MKSEDLQYKTQSTAEVTMFRAALKASGFTYSCTSYTDENLHRDFGWLVVHTSSYGKGSWGFNYNEVDYCRTVTRDELIDAILQKSRIEVVNLNPLAGDHAVAALDWDANIITVGCCKYSFDTIRKLYEVIERDK